MTSWCWVWSTDDIVIVPIILKMMSSCADGLQMTLWSRLRFNGSQPGSFTQRGWGTALRYVAGVKCSTLRHCGTVLRYVTGVLLYATWLGYCSTLRHWGTALRYVTGVLLYATSLWYCSTLRHCGTALRYVTGVKCSTLRDWGKMFYATWLG